MVSGLAKRLVGALRHLVAARADGRPHGRDDALGADAVVACSAPTPAMIARLAMPRHPAWMAATARPVSSARSTGTQSAIRTAIAAPGSLLTTAVGLGPRPRTGPIG